MKTLLLYLSGPQQSWGSTSKFNTRDTERFPTYSGVLGMIACTMGIRRDETNKLKALTELKMSVRIDQPGDICRDWQVAHSQKVEVDPRNKNHSACHRVISETDKPATYAANRYYLSDAKFIVALTGEDALVDRVASAIKHPIWAPYLGRKAFTPDAPLFLDIVDGDDILTIFGTLPWHASEKYRKYHHTLSLELWVDSRLMIEAPPAASYVRKDMPISFSPSHRKYLTHVMNEYFIPIEDVSNAQSAVHDPMGLLDMFNSELCE